MTDCTEPNRKACPRLCDSFCNKYEQEQADIRDGLAQGYDLIAQGYDLEELELDNPYNQWMYEQ